MQKLQKEQLRLENQYDKVAIENKELKNKNTKMEKLIYGNLKGTPKTTYSKLALPNGKIQLKGLMNKKKRSGSRDSMFDSENESHSANPKKGIMKTTSHASLRRKSIKFE